jgi:hypothetical protein
MFSLRSIWATWKIVSAITALTVLIIVTVILPNPVVTVLVWLLIGLAGAWTILSVSLVVRRILAGTK